jgi:predicted metal-dependent hydrolase
MTDLEIRRIRFDLDGDVPFNWNADNPAFSTYMNMVSIMLFSWTNG